MERPSEKIKSIIRDTQADYRYTCGTHECKCCINTIAVDAIVQYLDSEFLKKQPCK